MIPDAPLPSEVQQFDLALQAAVERRSARKLIGPYILILALPAGLIAIEEGARYLLFIDHSYSDRIIDVVWILAGSLILTAGAIAYRRVGGNEVVALRIDRVGIALVHRRGNSDLWRWNDPTFRVEICHLDGAVEEVVPADDIRRSSQVWLEAYRGSNKSSSAETLLTPPIADGIVAAANSYGLSVSIVRAAFFWQSQSKGPGFFTWQYEGDPHLRRNLNGTVTRLERA